MAVISGFVAGQTISGYDRLYLSADLDDYAPDWIDNLVYWASIPSPGATTLTTHWPVSAAPDTRTGWIARSYADDFYHRIHIVPRVLDIGNLLSVQTRQATVWNAHFTPQALSAINETGTTGLTESGIAPPTTFGALEERAYSITVDTNGPATIDARYEFAFPTETPVLRVSGRRVVVFGHAPNWAHRVTESYEWLTDVIASRGGIEQRIGLRGVPRRGLAYTLNTMARHESNRLDTLLLGWQARLFAVPVWTDSQRLAAALPAGSTAVACDTAGYEFAAGGLVVLWAAHDRHEALEIASVSGGGLVFASATLADWPAGTRLLPVRLGRLPAAQKLARLTGHHYEGEVSFAFEDHPGWTPADTGDDYLGYKVYLGRPNWREGIDLDHLRVLDELDYSTGARWINDASGLASLIKSWHWQLKGRAEIAAFRAWLAARDGRRVPFWSESQGDDMEITATIGASDSSIQIRNIGYQRLISGRADRRHIAIRTKAGAAYYRQITGATEIDEATEQLAIDTPLGATVQPADVASVRFLHLSRLEADSIEIDWSHLTLAESTAAMRSLPA